MINCNNLEIARLASKDASRFTLNGIQVTPERTVVTDGHMLVTVANPTFDLDSVPVIEGLTPTREFKPFILQTDDALALAKAIPGKSPIPIIKNAFIGAESTAEQSGSTVMHIGTTDLETKQVRQCRTLNGNYPDVDRVIPKKSNAEFVIGLDLALLNRLCGTLAKIVGKVGKARQPLTIRFYGPDAPMRIDAVTGDEQAIVAVLCPCRSDEARRVKMWDYTVPDELVA
jgi:hypothetical protein